MRYCQRCKENVTPVEELGNYFCPLCYGWISSIGAVWSAPRILRIR